MTFSDQADKLASTQMIDLFTSAGHHEIDTAHAYNDGGTELLLGELLSVQPRSGLYIASKVNPWHEAGFKADQIRIQLEQSLDRLKTEYLDLFYLHAPDNKTPIRQTLETCWHFYNQGKFRQFGLSNYAAWQVAEITEICRQNGWMMPVVYQGMYNALTRDVEAELFPCLRNYGISFKAYNPLAGGLLSGKYGSVEQIPSHGRFAIYDFYQQRYWKNEYFTVIEQFRQACSDNNIDPAGAALRWLIHHSMLCSDSGDGIILGASRPEQLTANLDACAQGALPSAIVDILNQGWEKVRPVCIDYFRT